MKDTSTNKPRSLFEIAESLVAAGKMGPTGFANEEALKEEATVDEILEFTDKLVNAVKDDPTLKAEVAAAWKREVDDFEIEDNLVRFEPQAQTLKTNQIKSIEDRLGIPKPEKRIGTPRKPIPTVFSAPPPKQSRTQTFGSSAPEKPNKPVKTTLAEGMKSALQAAGSAPGVAYRSVSAIPRVISKGVKTAKRAVTGGPDYTKYDAKKLIQLLTHSTPGSDRADKVMKAIDAKIKAADTPEKQTALREDFKTEKFSKGGLGSGETILTAAARYGHQNVVDTLLKHEDVLQVKNAPRTNKGKQHFANEYLDEQGKITVPAKQRKFYNSEKLAAAAVVGGAIGATGGLAAAPVLAAVGVNGGMPAIAPLLTAAAAKLGAVTGITAAANAIAAGGASTLSSAGIAGLASQAGAATGITGVANTIAAGGASTLSSAGIAGLASQAGAATGITGAANTIAAGGASTLSSAGMTGLVSQVGSATGITGAINTTASFLSSLATSAGAHTLGYVGVGATGQALGGAAMVGTAGGLATAGTMIAADKTVKAVKGTRSKPSSQPERTEVENPLHAKKSSEPEIDVLRHENGKFQNADGGPTVHQHTSASGKVSFTFENIPEGKSATISTPRLGDDGKPKSPPILDILTFDHSGKLVSREFAEVGNDGKLTKLDKSNSKVKETQTSYDQTWLNHKLEEKRERATAGELPKISSIVAAAKAHAAYSADGISAPSMTTAAVSKKSEIGRV